MSYNIADNGSLVPIAGNTRPASSNPDIAEEEFSPATKAHPVGDYFYYNGYLYKVIMPITMGATLVDEGNIEKVDVTNELENRVNKSDSQYVQITLASTGWVNGEYSLESLYPSASYDIENVTTCEASTEAMRKAWNKADCTGYAATNKIIAHGTVPSINIIISMKVIKK